MGTSFKYSIFSPILDIWKRWIQGTVNQKIFAALLTVGAMSGLVKGFSLFRELLIAYAFGTSDDVDAFLISFMIPSFVISVVSGSFKSAVVPAYIHERETNGNKAAETLFHEAMTLVLVSLLACTLILYVSIPLILPVFASGFGAEKIELTRKLLIILLPGIVLNGLIMLFNAVLNSSEKFALGSISFAVVPIISSIFIIFLRDELGIYCLSYGILLGYILQSMILYMGLVKTGNPVFFRWNGLTPPIKSIIDQYFPLMAGMLLASSALLIDQSMAAMLPSGSVASLSYGNKIPFALIGICSTALGSAILPYFSKMVAEQNFEGLSATFKKYSRYLLSISIPSVILLILLSNYIVVMVFERGAFVAEDTEIVSKIQALYFLQIPPFLMTIIQVRVLNSLRKNNTLYKIAALNLISNIMLNYILMKFMGIHGIALSTSISQTVSALMAAWYLSREGTIKIFYAN